MTSTTELLKEIDKLDKNGVSLTSFGRRFINAELKGRLDALKEEVEFLDKLQLETQFRNFINPMIENRLTSIQEEIKLIEGRING